MIKLDRVRMQRLAGNQRALGKVWMARQLAAIQRAPSVHAVPHYRMAQEAHVYAELVSAPGLGVQFHQCERPWMSPGRLHGCRGPRTIRPLSMLRWISSNSGAISAFVCAVLWL